MAKRDPPRLPQAFPGGDMLARLRRSSQNLDTAGGQDVLNDHPPDARQAVPESRKAASA